MWDLELISTRMIDLINHMMNASALAQLVELTVEFMH